MSEITNAPQVRPEPIGVRYCLTHSGMREADEGRGCDWLDDDPEKRCELVELYPGVEVVDSYLDPAYEDEDDDE